LTAGALFHISFHGISGKTERADLQKRFQPAPLGDTIINTDDGLHIKGSILWLDSANQGDLTFMSSASMPFVPKAAQVIATEDTVRILESFNHKPNTLVCQYNRPFSIGRLKMELLPSGCVLGGASLYLETENNRILYAPKLQPNRISTIRQMQLKKAHTLILGVDYADPEKGLPNRKKERERLLEKVQMLSRYKEWPVIVCDPLTVAQEITHLLTNEDIPVAVHDTIFKIHKVYEQSGSKLGKYTKYNRKHTKEKVTIFPMSRQHFKTPRAQLPEGPLLYIESGAENSIPPGAFRNVMERFHLAPVCDGDQIREIVLAVNPKELFIVGPYAKRYAQELRTVMPQAIPLFANNQPTLI
jgi:hypothetical protein